MALLGVVLTFMSKELLHFTSNEPTAVVSLLAQVCGALYLGFAMLNWTARANLIGGIYSRPTVIGNLLHFTMITLVLFRSILNGQRGVVIMIGLFCYATFAVWFGLVLMARPLKAQ